MFIQNIYSGKLDDATRVAFGTNRDSLKIKRSSLFTTTKKSENDPIWLFLGYIYSRLNEKGRDTLEQRMTMFNILQKLFNVALDKKNVDKQIMVFHTMLSYMYLARPKTTIDVVKLRSHHKVICMALSSNLIFVSLKKNMSKL